MTAIWAIRPSWATLNPDPVISRSRNWVMRRAASRLFQPAQASTRAWASRRRVFCGCRGVFIDICIYKYRLRGKVFYASNVSLEARLRAGGGGRRYANPGRPAVAARDRQRQGADRSLAEEHRAQR